MDDRIVPSLEPLQNKKKVPSIKLSKAGAAGGGVFLPYLIALKAASSAWDPGRAILGNS